MAQVALFIARLLEVYSFVIWIRILMSWIVPYPQPGSFSYYLALLVDPFLNMFRSKNFRVGMLDFSPLIAIGLLTVVQSVFSIYGYYGRITLALIVQLFINAFWSYGISIFFTISLILIVLMLIASFMRTGQFKYAMSALGNNTFGSLKSWIQRTFFKKRILTETTMNIVVLVIFAVLYFASKELFMLLMRLAAKIPF